MVSWWNLLKVRRGDPISPFLFVMSMEYLTRMMKSLRKQPLYKYHPRCDVLHITHLTFADDLLFFAKGNLSSISTLMELFEEFNCTSGLVANKHKCEIFFAGVKPQMKDSILSKVQMKEGVLSFRYLAIPLNAKRLAL